MVSAGSTLIRLFLLIRKLYSSAVEHLPLELQEAEENFDLSLVASLEIDVVPYLGETSIPDYIISQLARVLQQGSRLRSNDDELPPSPSSLPDVSIPRAVDKRSMDQPFQDFDKIQKFGDGYIGVGTTLTGHFLPRERFSYWCFDLLFLICSDTSQGKCSSLASMSRLFTITASRPDLIAEKSSGLELTVSTRTVPNDPCRVCCR